MSTVFVRMWRIIAILRFVHSLGTMHVAGRFARHLYPFLKKAVPDDVLVLPAHNEPFRGLHARLQNLIDSHERSLERLAKRLQAKPRRAIDTFGALFAREIGKDLLGMATGEAIAHLNCLVARGRAGRERQADGTLVWFAKP